MKITDEQIVANILRFNKELMELNVKYSEEIERLNNKLKEIDNLVKEVNEAPLVAEDMFNEFYDKYYELKDSDKE